MELRLLNDLPEKLRFFFRELIRLARAYTTLDDLEHYQTTRVNPVARQAALEVGKRFVQAGILAASQDIFFLRRDELAELVAEFPRVDREAFRQRSFPTERHGTRNAIACRDVRPRRDVVVEGRSNRYRRRIARNRSHR